ncbi:MAG: hypothetical protein M3N13_01470 [Candidatus Eremiobacteraeota bacterium]|nr:hypothetical protein [Candidatus Eremiobacteraeota bacterium]
MSNRNAALEALVVYGKRSGYATGAVLLHYQSVTGSVRPCPTRRLNVVDDDPKGDKAGQSRDIGCEYNPHEDGCKEFHAHFEAHDKPPAEGGRVVENARVNIVPDPK